MHSRCVNLLARFSSRHPACPATRDIRIPLMHFGSCDSIFRTRKHRQRDGRRITGSWSRQRRHNFPIRLCVPFLSLFPQQVKRSVSLSSISSIQGTWNVTSSSERKRESIVNVMPLYQDHGKAQGSKKKLPRVGSKYVRRESTKRGKLFGDKRKRPAEISLDLFSLPVLFANCAKCYSMKI